MGSRATLSCAEVRQEFKAEHSSVAATWQAWFRYYPNGCYTAVELADYTYLLYTALRPYNVSSWARGARLGAADRVYTLQVPISRACKCRAPIMVMPPSATIPPCA